jgi:lipopolysaccharide transport system permease protein
MTIQKPHQPIPAEYANGSPPEPLLYPMLRVRPASGWAPLQLADLWAYRGLLYFLIWRDIKVRYKQTILGAAWAIIQPVCTMVVFSIFFGQLANIPSEGIPYPIFAYTALVPWMYFANALSRASNSLVEQERLITKVYFPRLIIPMAAVLSGLVDFALAFVVLIGMMLFYRIVPTSAIWSVPLFVLLAIMVALGIGLWLAALNVLYRDVRYVTAFLIQFWLFATPVAYSSNLVPGYWRTLYGLNPMAGVVEGFRWALLGQAQAPGALLLVSILVVVGVLIGGLYYFQHMEQTFVDVV